MDNIDKEENLSKLERREKQYMPIILTIIFFWIAVRICSILFYTYVIDTYQTYNFHVFEVISFLVGILIFIHLMTKWKNGADSYLLLKTLIILSIIFSFFNILDILINHVINKQLLYNTIFRIYYALTNVSLFSIVIILMFTFFSRHIYIEDKVKNFFIPMYIKIAIIIYCSIMIVSSLIISIFIHSYEQDQKDLIISFSREAIARNNNSLTEYIQSIDSIVSLNKVFIKNTILSNDKIDRLLLSTEIYSNLVACDSVADNYLKKLSVTIDAKHALDNLETTLEISNLQKPSYSIYTEKDTGKVDFVSIMENSKRINIYSDTHTSTIKYTDESGNKHFDCVLDSPIYLRDEIVGYIKATFSGNIIHDILASGVEDDALWTYILYDMPTYEIYDSNNKDLLSSSIYNYYKSNNWYGFLDGIHNRQESYSLKLGNVNEDGNSHIFLASKIDVFNAVAIYTAENNSVMSSTENYKRVNTNFIIIFFVIHIVTILFTLFIRGILKTLAITSKYAMYIKDGKGDLRTRLDIESNDEVGDFSYNFNGFISMLDNVIGEIKKESVHLDGEVTLINSTVGNSAKIVSEQTLSITEAVSSVNNIMKSISTVAIRSNDQKETFNLVSSSVSDLLKTVMKINDSMTKQSASVEETSASIEEMISNINSVAKSVSRAEEYSTKLLNDAKAGGYSVEEVISAIRDIEESSDQIRDIIKVIQSIAERTNLLAMNAAIEAAHAGDQGRGFAIVADQIRSLAESTADNTKTITAIIKDITKRVEKTLDIAVDSGKSLDSIVSASGSTARIISEINVANTELEVGGLDMLETLKHLNIITQQVKENVHEQINSGEAVESQIKLLKTITSDMSDSIELNTVVAKEIIESMTLLTDLSEKSKNANDNLFDALNGLNMKFKELSLLTFNFTTSIDAPDVKSENKAQNIIKDLDELIEESKAYSDNSDDKENNSINY